MNILPDPTSMRAAVLHGVGDLRMEDIPRPQAGPGEVLMQVGACGVCGSDIPRVWHKGTYRFPTVCGHEFAGTVAAVGAGVTDMPLGQAVTVFPLLWCGRCAACEQGQYARCQDYGYLGSRSDGGFATYVVAPRRNLLPLPAGVSIEEGAMTEPAAVALHALRRGGGCAPGETVVVFGAGPVGLLVAQWARASGAAQVLIFDLQPQALDLARTLDFTLVFAANVDDPLSTVMRLTDGRLADITVEAAGAAATLTAAITCAGNGGRVILLGNPNGDVTLTCALISTVMRRELSLVGTWNSSFSATGNHDDWRSVLAAVAAGTIQLKPLITHRFPLAGTVEALVLLRDRHEYAAKVLIEAQL